MKSPVLHLNIGATANVLIAMLHIPIAIGGADWYRMFRAGDLMVSWAEAGSPLPTLVTVFVTIVFSAFAAYGYSASGVLPRLPATRLALKLIAGVYLLRAGIGGAGALFEFVASDDISFFIWTSIIACLIGLSYVRGLSIVR